MPSSETDNEATSIAVDGRELARVRFGEERHVEDSPCVGCGTYYFDVHRSGCEFEECPSCGGQLIACGCAEGA